MDIFYIVLCIIFFVTCLYLRKENQELKEKIKELEFEKNNNKKISLIDKDTVSIQTLSEESSSIKKSTSKDFPSSKDDSAKPVKLENKVLEKKKPRVTEELKTSTTLKITNSSSKEFSSPIENRNSSKKLYQKNIFTSQPKVTSPVGIQDNFDVDKLTLDLNEFIKKSERVVPQIKEKPSQKKNDYLKKISEEMADAMTSQAIELTDYEKDQEEHAIISYQELLAVKDQLSILDDEEESVNFIEDLKKFRNHLK